jgi:hypothetical protein
MVKDKFKVIKVEDGIYDYNTIFIDVDKNAIQIPILKTAMNDKQIVGKTILIPCELIDENTYLFNQVITKIEFV